MSNPPHYHQADPDLARFGPGTSGRLVDTDWLLHRRFYAGVHRFLTPGRGHVIFVENHEGSRLETFAPMLEGGTGLSVANVESLGGLQ